MKQPFFNLYSHDFSRVAVAVPSVALSVPEQNVQRTIALMHQAIRNHASLVVFPELGLTGYSCDDLFQQEALLSSAVEALLEIIRATAGHDLLAIVGLPLRQDGHLFNCAAVLQNGRILGVVPKTYLPNYREFHEARQFSPAATALRETIDLPGQTGIPFGHHLIFRAKNQPLFSLAVEICEDLWVPVPPSSYAALAGATVIVNPSASNATLGKANYRRQLVSNQSARCLSAYLYSAAGMGESTTDLAWDGHGLIADYGEIKSESERFSNQDQLVFADIDLLRLTQERMRQNTFAHAVQLHADVLRHHRTVDCILSRCSDEHLPLVPPPARYPFVPSTGLERNARCEEVFQIQIQGLSQRLRSSGLHTLVIGVSGGLDSTHALLVASAALDALGLPRDHLLAYTLPGFATSDASLALSRSLMSTLGLKTREIDIRPACLQMLKDIGHPYASGEPVFDVTFENVQAGQRASHLFRLANQHHALVVGTSDLSELALGWCTYGVGDHMAHYHVNSGVPKTLVQYLVHWVADAERFGPDTSEILRQVLRADISPELVPATAGSGQTQRTEDTVGPYALQDFNLYHLLRFGFSPDRVAFMAWCAWHDPQLGHWPQVSEQDKKRYGIVDIRHWLEVFVKRFFQNSQFKRSCIANGPKVGSGGSLSPRGDWRAPSDSSAHVWLEAVRRIPMQNP